jgi:hypothetical protein
MTDSEMIDAFITERGVSKCPTVFAVPSQQLALDKFVVVPLVQAGEKIEDTIVRLYRDHKYPCHFLCTMSGLGSARVTHILSKAGIFVKSNISINARKRNKARNDKVMVLHGKGYSAEEIGVKVGLSAKHVRSLLQTGRRV